MAQGNIRRAFAHSHWNNGVFQNQLVGGGLFLGGECKARSRIYADSTYMLQ